MLELTKCRQKVRNTLGPTSTTTAMSTTCIASRVPADQATGAPRAEASASMAWKPRKTYQVPQFSSASGA
ncbi:hypothetical protein D3C78_670870 [compost metagenome]